MESGTVFIVDSDASDCCALSLLLNSAGYATVSFASPNDLLARLDPRSAGCIILGAAITARDESALHKLRDAGCRHPVIFLTDHATIAVTVRAIRSGALNVLSKPIESSDLFGATDEALRIDAEDRRVSGVCSTVAGRLAGLTPRQRQVLDLVVSGRLNKQIAADLSIAEKTVKVHRARVMKKMEVRSLAELVRVVSLAGISAEERSQQIQGSSMERFRLRHGEIRLGRARPLGAT
jgi:FixJ family two-component response regulator